MCKANQCGNCRGKCKFPETPILDRLIREEKAFIDPNGIVVGIASDGCGVQLGHNKANAEYYLKIHPNPKDW